MHARYFSAHTGRFMSTDPVGALMGWPQSWNRYSYVLGNPVKYVDPRGEFAQLGYDALSEIFRCLESGECANEVVNVTDEFDPLTGVSGYADLVQGSAFTLGLSGAIGGGTRLPGLNTGERDSYKLNIYERFVSDLDIDGLEFGRCIEKNRFDLGAVVTAVSVGNPVANKLAGDTGRMGFGGLGRHPTSWQHKAGASLSRAFKNPTFSRVGKFAGRAALVPTVFEGFYDIGTIGRCAVVTGGN